MSPRQKARTKRRVAPRKPKRAAAKKRAPKRAVAKKRAPKRAAKRGAKPPLRLVRRAAKRPAPPPAFPQTADASAKQRLLFDLVRAHTAVTAAIQGLLPASAERPMGAGKWSIRETVLHLVTRDRIRLREMEAVLRGATPSWKTIDEDEQSRINQQDLSGLLHHPWDEAVRLLHATRRELMETIESISDEPAGLWVETHPFGWMMTRLAPHDRHHADAIKRWR